MNKNNLKRSYTGYAIRYVLRDETGDKRLDVAEAIAMLEDKIGYFDCQISIEGDYIIIVILNF